MGTATPSPQPRIRETIVALPYSAPHRYALGADQVRSWVRIGWEKIYSSPFCCLYIEKLSTVFRSFTPQNDRLVMSFNEKNDQRVAAHLFRLYIEKLSTVFRSFTDQNDNIMMSFNRKNDQRVAAHLFCFYIGKNLYSISIVHPSKWSPCDVIQSEKWSARRGASFLTLYWKALYSISIVYLSKWQYYDVIQ